MSTVRPFRQSLFIAAVAAAFALSFSTQSNVARAQDRASERDTAPQMLDVSPTAIAQVVLAPVDEARLRAEDAESRGRIGPQRIGVARAVDVTPATGGTWASARPGGAADARAIWRHRVRSNGARGLSLRFEPFAPPPGSELFIYNGQGQQELGPYTRADATRGRLVTPMVSGESVVVELRLPPARHAADRQTGIRLVSATHHYRDLNALPQAAKSGSCNVDVACAEADPYRDLIRAVARISFERGGFSFVCTGSLVNNTNLDGRPFFLTAEHCVEDAATASTVVFYWNFENSTCRPPGSAASGADSDDDPNEETSTGAILRARYGNVHSQNTISGKPDLTLLEIDDPAGLGDFDVYFAGWDVTGVTPSSGVSIHHPGGDAKRIAIDSTALRRTEYLSTTSTSAGTHWRIGDWEVGTTEGGSSGSFVLDENNRIVGVLSGGSAGCTFGGTDNDLPDWYGALAAGFDENDYVSPESATFRDWLDPAGTGTDVLDGDDLVNLPVELLSFDVQGTADGLTVRWSTSSETNNAGFRLSLARGHDVFTDAGRFVAGAGVSSTVTTYRQTLTGLEPGRYRLRLRQIDTDGAETVVASGAAQVQVNGEVFIRPIQPHPVTRSGKMEMTVRTSQHVRVALFDMLGRRVGQLHDGPVRGQTRLSLQLDGSGLAAGTYLLRITGERFARTERVVIAR
jgi:lysyl endopeptidase